MQVTGDILEDEAADLAAAVEQVVAHHIGGELHAGQPGGVAQLGAVGAHPAGEGGREGLDLHILTAGGDLHDGAGLHGALVIAVDIGTAVGGHDGEGVGGVGVAVLVLIAPGLGGDHHAADGAGGLGGGEHGDHFAVPTQQEGDGVSHPEGAQIADGVSGGGGLDGVALPGHGDGGRGRGGGDGLEGTGDAVGVHPEGVHGFGPVHYVVLDQSVGAGDLPRPVHRGTAEVEGDLLPPAALAHHYRAVHGLIEKGQGVHLAVGGEAVSQDGGEVGRSGSLGGGGEQVIEEIHGVLAGHGIILSQRDALIQV